MPHWNIVRRHRHRTPSHFLKALHEVAQRVDHDTAATVTVVLRRSSGSYRDVEFLLGAIVAWLGLIALLFLPWDVAEWSVPIDVVVLFALSAWLCSRTRLRRWLTSRRRQRRQVRHTAHVAFVEEGVWHAPRNQGVLIYWSRLERQVEVVAGMGLHGRVPAHEWNTIVHALRQAPRQEHTGKVFVERLKELGALLAAHLPALAHESAALRSEGAR